MKPVKKAHYSSEQVHAIKVRLRQHKLHTVCEEARCPNLGECFTRGTATFMILGDTCTRSCGFCAVKRWNRGTMERWNVQPEWLNMKPLPPPDPDEPERIAKMIAELKLKHAVITSVTRDDLPDEGATQFAKTINFIQFLGRLPISGQHEKGICQNEKQQIHINTERKQGSRPTIEVLTPDFHARADCLKIVCDAKPDIYNHNIETVRRLTKQVRSDANYDRSLEVLKWVSNNYPNITLKSGLMVGLGELEPEVIETLRDLQKVGCKIVTIGQYLSPSKKNLTVKEFVEESTFNKYKVIGEEFGIKYVFSGSFIRSSYMAEQTLKEALWTETSR